MSTNQLLDLIANDGDLCRADYYRSAYPQAWAAARRANLLNVWADDTGSEYVELGPQQ